MCLLADIFSYSVSRFPPIRSFLQVKTVVSMFIRRFEIEAMGPLPTPNYRAMVVGPNPPTVVKYKLRKA
jgi:hypothetical protein